MSICGAFFQIRHTQPLPHPTKNVDAYIQNFLMLQHCIGCGEGERRDIFEKATLLYEGTLTIQKIHCSKNFCPEL